MSDRTSFTVEVYDPTYNFGGGSDPDDNWSPVGLDVDTFTDAQEAVTRLKATYRTVRIRKHVYTQVALYQDGVPVE